MKLEEAILNIFIKKKKTLAVAESCTGGLISSRVTDVSGSSKYFKGAVVAYANDVKIDILGVPSALIKKHGAVSREVAKEMAIGVREILGSDVGVAVTGIAGPTGSSKDKPLGLAYVALSTNTHTKTKKVQFKGDRPEIKDKFAESVLKLIKENV